MKRIVSLILCLCVTGTLFGATVFANMEDALAIVKSRIDIPPALTEFTSATQNNTYGTVYSFTWTSKDQKKNEFMSADCDENGIITSYNHYAYNEYYNNNAFKFPKLSKDDAKQKAVSFFNKLNPDIKDKVVFKDNNNLNSLWENNYMFYFVRVENGVEFPRNSGNISISKDTKDIENFNMEWWSDATFANPADAISKDVAKTAYTKEIGLELIYQDDYQNGSDPKLVYVEKGNSNEYIDALTGKVIKQEQMFYGGYKDLARNSTDGKGGGGEGFTPQELSEIEENANLLSEDKIIEIIKANKVIDITNTYNKIYSSVYEDYNIKGKYYWNISFADEKSDLNVNLDAKTGKILSFNHYREQKDDKKISNEVALKNANDAAKYMDSDMFKHYKLRTSDNYSFNYVRYVNEIPYVNDTININIDSNTGKVVDYSFNFSDKKFPSAKSVISLETATAKLFEKVNYSLKYISENNSYIPYKSSQLNPHITKLVYDFDDSINILIDANTGEFNINTPVEKPISYKDIKGHYAEEVLNKLAQYGIGFEVDELKPDDGIIQKDYIALLAMVFRDHNPRILNDEAMKVSAYNNMVSSGIVKENEKNENALVTREDAAKFLVRAIGIDEYASLLGIYKCPFADVTSNIGHISILSAMGIMKGNDDGLFAPKDTLSRAQAFIIIYNYLSR